MVFIIDDEDPPVEITGAQFRVEQSARLGQWYAALAGQDAQGQVSAMLSLVGGFLSLLLVLHVLASAIGVKLHAFGQDLDDIAQNL